MKYILYPIGAFVSVLIITFFLNAVGLVNMKVFGPRYEAVRRETFEQSKAYNEGMCQEIRNMQFEYVQASPSQQTALRSVILHRVAGYPIENAPADIQIFISQLRSSR